MSWVYISASQLCVQREHIPSAAVTSHQVCGLPPKTVSKAFLLTSLLLGVLLQQQEKKPIQKANSGGLTPRRRQGWTFSGDLGLSSSPSLF